MKLTGLGLELDHDLCRENLEAVVRDAAARGNFVRIDMEDSSTTDRTLELYRELRRRRAREHAASCCRRTCGARSTISRGSTTFASARASTSSRPSSRTGSSRRCATNYVRCLERLVEQGSYVGIATHDEYLIGEALRIVREAGLAHDRYEFQMLLGVRPDRADELVAAGHRLRIYVPFGQHWYEYSLRRLQENPKIAGYVAADTVARVFGR